MDDYIAGVKSAWLGEQHGRAAFTALAEAAGDAGTAGKWKTLAQLEQVTGQRMAALLESYGEMPDEPFIDVEAIVDRFSTESHLEIMADMKKIIGPAIERFDRLLGIAPESDIDAVQFLVDHEVALMTFVDRELEGRADSLAQVEALLAGPGGEGQGP